MLADGGTEERLAGQSCSQFPRKAVVDAHVHLYQVFNRNRFLTEAVRHARAAGAALPWLLFTETAKDFAFRELTVEPPKGWTSRLLGDSRTLLLSKESGEQVLLTAGRQIQTAEGLELLALGMDDLVPDGVPLQAALAKALDAGALPVIPWGFGKWSGRRGRILRDLLAGPHGHRLFLGDNGGRPWFWPEPKPFHSVAMAGRRVLPGSDPLPFKSHEGRAGSYGLLVDISLEDDRPFDHLVDALTRRDLQAAKVGKLAGSLSFFCDQTAMQIIKRTRK
jgi:hypothetical protein